MMRRKTFIAGVCLAGVCALVAILLRGTERTSEVGARDAEGHGRVAEAGYAARLSGRATEAPQQVAEPECAWFQPWSESPPNSSDCAAVLGAMRPVTAGKVNCLSKEWIAQILMSSCDMPLPLVPGEVALLLDDPKMVTGIADLLRAVSKGDAAPPASVSCLARHLARTHAPLSPAEWAEVLTSMGKSVDGGLYSADPTLVALATALLVEHETSEAAWWRSFLRAQPPSVSGAAHARRALYEALVSRVPEGAEEAVLEDFAGLEDGGSPAGSLGLAALGLVMGDRIASARALEIMAFGSGANWRRAVVWSQGFSKLWPARDWEPAPQVRDALLEVILTPPSDSETTCYRRDLLHRAWNILGPEAAARELALFVQSPMPDERELALRIASACEVFANNEGSASTRTYRTFRGAQLSLRQVLDSGISHLDEIIEQTLASPKMRSRANRDVLIRILGGRIHNLRKDIYQRLVR